MKRFHVATALIAAAFLATSAAQAQATRTWVSGVGDDANPCSRTAPCKTFAGAISKTAAGGEISVLDPGGFGAVTITKAITIDGDGTLAGILSAGTNGIIINAGVNDRVIIRSVSINGVGTGLNGIRFLAGKSLTVENVTMTGFTGRGIDMSVAADTRLLVNNTTITNAVTGIFLSASAGRALAVIDNVSLRGLTNGLEASTNGQATISNSVMGGNASNGVLVSAASARVNINNCQIERNEVAAVNVTASGAIIRMSGNQLSSNITGVVLAAGAFYESAGDNRLSGTGTSATPTSAITSQ